MNFESLINDVIPANHAPSGINGCYGKIDLANPVEFINPRNKWVLNSSGQFSMRHTIAYWISSGDHGEMVVPTVQSIKARYTMVGEALAIREILHVFTKVGGDITYRGSDVIKQDEFDLCYGEAADASVAVGTADKIVQNLYDEPVALAAATGTSKHFVTAIIATAIHRSENEDHAWYTDQADKRGTGTNKLLKCAGANRDEFKVYMSSRGHDSWHPLTTSTLSALAAAISGETSVKLNGQVTYGGKLHLSGSSTMAMVIGLPAAATDRYPPGIMGTSAMHVGLDAMKAMVSTVSSKVALPYAGELLIAIEKVKTDKLSKIRDREELMECRIALVNPISLAYGFCVTTRAISDVVEGKTALSTAADKNVAFKAAGINLAERISEMDTDPGAVSSSLGSAMSGIAAGLLRLGGGFSVDTSAKFTTTTQIAAATAKHKAKTDLRLTTVSAMEKLSAVVGKGIKVKDLSELDA